MIPGLPKSSLREVDLHLESIEEAQEMLEEFEAAVQRDSRRAAVGFYAGVAMLIGGLAWIHLGLGAVAAGLVVVAIFYGYGRDVMKGRSLVHILRHVVEHQEHMDEQMKEAVEAALRDAHKHN